MANSSNVAKAKPDSKKRNKANQRAFRVLQPTAQTKQVLVGREKGIQLTLQNEKTKSKGKTTSCKVYSEEKENSHIEETITNTPQKASTKKSDSNDENLIVNEKIPERYWEQLAEDRRIALVYPLEENKTFHLTIAYLRMENERLKKRSGYADELEEILSELITTVDEPLSTGGRGGDAAVVDLLTSPTKKNSFDALDPLAIEETPVLMGSSEGALTGAAITSAMRASPHKEPENEKTKSNEKIVNCEIVIEERENAHTEETTTNTLPKASLKKPESNQSNDEEYDFMMNGKKEEFPERHWELLAEQRSIALDETLQENEELQGIISNLQAENDELEKREAIIEGLEELLNEFTSYPTAAESTKQV